MACFSAVLILTCPNTSELYSADYTPFDQISVSKIYVAILLAEINVLTSLLLSKLFKKKLASENWKEVIIFNAINFVGVSIFFSVILVVMRVNL